MENEETIEEVVDGVVEETVDNKVEDRAKLQGWTPKESFKGDPERWITAEEFVERADNMMPILKSVNKKLEKQLTEVLDKYGTLENKLKEQEKLTKKMIQIHGKYSQESFESKRAELETRKLQAVHDGNTELYQELNKEQEKIVKPETIEVQDDTVEQDHPEIKKWKGENKEWYGKDEELTEYADIIANRMGAKGHSYKEYEFCEAVKKKVQTMFPDKFKNPNAQKETPVDEPGTRGSEISKSKKKGWSDLPKDAKNICAELVASVPGYTKEKYMTDYFEEA